MQDTKSNVKVVRGGPSLSVIPTIVFVILKLCNVINWSWFWVLSPLIFGAALTILLVIFAVLIAICSD